LHSGKARGFRLCSERNGDLLVRALAQFLNISGFDQPVTANTKTIIINFFTEVTVNYLESDV
jgi:hypothetical protein